jgi:SulP family sulfate permease
VRPTTSIPLPGEANNPLFAWPTYAEFTVFMRRALVIAALGALESLLSATVADSMAGTRHTPNAELNGIGIANILSGLFSGIPATGAIARTATNVNAGAKTPIASSLHGVFLLIYMLLLAPLISYIPMAFSVAIGHRLAHVARSHA